jgi:DNA repair exonuclease SbcCD ATPase subunit
MWDPLLDAVEFVKGGRYLSDLKFLKSSWSCPEMLITPERRQHIWQQFWDMCAKNRWIYHSKYSISIATHTPGVINEKHQIKSDQLRRAEELFQITRGPELNSIGDDPLPSAGSEETGELLKVQDSLHQLGLKQEELRTKQSQTEVQLEDLKGEARTLKRQLRKMEEEYPKKIAKFAAQEEAIKSQQKTLKAHDMALQELKKKFQTTPSFSTNDTSSESLRLIKDAFETALNAKQHCIQTQEMVHQQVIKAKDEAHQHVVKAKDEAHQMITEIRVQSHQAVINSQKEAIQRSESLYDAQMAENFAQNSHKREMETLNVVVTSSIDKNKLKAMKLLGLNKK